jgi:hypothetical protein
MGSDVLHQNSSFVVCRACHGYFHTSEIDSHQDAAHKDTDWGSLGTTRYYYLMSNEVTFYLNRFKEIQETINKLRLLVF